MNQTFVLSVIVLSLHGGAVPGTAETEASDTSFKVCVRPNAGFLELVEDRVVGFEYELLASFAASRELELEIDWLDSFAEMIPAVELGQRCDLGSAAITVTDERRQRVDFSDPYFSARVVVVEGSSNRSTSVEDLAGRSVAVVGGTFQESLLSEVEGVDIVALETDEALFESLSSGQVDALVCDSVVLLRFLSQMSDLQASFFLSEPADMGFAFPKGKGELRRQLNEHLDELRTSGGFRAALVTSFGEAAAAVVLGEDG